jgi:dienelactone hydrolase
MPPRGGAVRNQESAMAIQSKTVRYEVNGKAFEDTAVWDDTVSGPRPVILIAPTFMDKSAFEEEKAGKLAALGYLGIAIDLFGVDIQPKDFEEASAAMQALNGDRKALAERMEAAFDQARALDQADKGRVAAIGFCLGGKCVLDLARQGAPLKGVVTFHGIFDQPGIPTADTISAKILALHGWDDPLAKPDQVIAFAAEMTEKKADWQLHAYGHAQHGFTNYNRKNMYRENADHRSWQAMTNFLDEIFA